MGAKLILAMNNDTRLWINPAQIIKMERSPDGRFFIYLTNGEVYEVDRRMAGAVENYFEYCQ